MIRLVIKFTSGLACYGWKKIQPRARPLASVLAKHNFAADCSLASVISLLRLVSVIVLPPLSMSHEGSHLDTASFPACSTSASSMRSSRYHCREFGLGCAATVVGSTQEG
jgi:hypothetical protein